MCEIFQSCKNQGVAKTELRRRLTQKYSISHLSALSIANIQRDNLLHTHTRANTHTLIFLWPMQLIFLWETIVCLELLAAGTVSSLYWWLFKWALQKHSSIICRASPYIGSRWEDSAEVHTICSSYTIFRWIIDTGKLLFTLCWHFWYCNVIGFVFSWFWRLLIFCIY